MSTPYFVSYKELLALNLSEVQTQEILKTKTLGFQLGIESGYFDTPFNKRIVKISNPAKIHAIHPKSPLNNVISLGDLILGVNNLPLMTDYGGDLVLESTTGSLTSFFGYLEKIQEGESLKIHYAEKRVKNDTQVSNMNGREVYEFKMKEVDLIVSFMYDLKDFPNVIKTLENKKIKNLPLRLKKNLFNQDHAIDEVYESLKIYFAGLKDPEKPIGGYLLLGPTGTGKTELAKLISKELDFSLIRLDMSEYSESHTISRIIGSPPGYVGHDKTTIFEEKIGDEGIKAVLLLDEMEKAHPEVKKAFLQVLDNRYLTLGNGKKVDFSNVLILMTSNAGISQTSGIGLGVDPDQKKLSVDFEGVKRLFLPEFLGRLSALIPFNSLEEKHAHLILGKFINNFESRVKKNHGINLEFSENLKEFLVKKGFDKIYGARPLKNILGKKVFGKIADLILFDSNKSETIFLDLKDGKVVALYKHSLNLEIKERELVNEN